jgi:TolA-binding protein
MENIKQISILEEIEQLSKKIQELIIQKSQTENNYNERLKILYNRMYNLHAQLKTLISPLSIQKDDSNPV